MVSATQPFSEIFEFLSSFLYNVILFLLGGDFRQVLPVVPQATQSVVMDTCLKRSNIWPHFHQIKLTQNMRAREDEQDFSRWLLELGNGTLIANIQPPQRDIIEIPGPCIVKDLFGRRNICKHNK